MHQPDIMHLVFLKSSSSEEAWFLTITSGLRWCTSSSEDVTRGSLKVQVWEGKDSGKQCQAVQHAVMAACQLFNHG